MTFELLVLAAVVTTSVLTAVLVTYLARRGRVFSGHLDPNTVASEEPRTTPQATTLVLGPSDRPLVQIECLPANLSAMTRVPITAPRGLLSSLSPLMSGIPTLANATNMAAGATYLLRFSPEVTRALADGSGAIVPSLHGGLRAIARDGAGKFIGNGSLIPTSVSPVTAALVVWQVASIIVAQKHLADISRKLDSIVHGISEIRNWLEVKDLSSLQANMRYMTGIGEAIGSGRLTEREVGVYVAQLESIERETNAIAVAAESRVQTSQLAFEAQKLDGVGLTENSTKAREIVRDFQRAARAGLAALEVRGAAAQLRSALPVDTQLTLNRLNDAAKDFGSLTSSIRRFDDTVNARAPSLRGYFSFDDTDVAHQGHLTGELLQARESLKAPSAQLARMLEDAADVARRQSIGEPFLIEATLDADGQVIGIARLVDPNSSSATEAPIGRTQGLLARSWNEMKARERRG